MRSWNRPPRPATPPPTPITGPVVMVNDPSDLKNLKSKTTYQWAPGYVHQGQLLLEGLRDITLIDPSVTGAKESNIYVVDTINLTVRGGSLTNSRTKTGLLTDGKSNGLVMVGVTCTGNGEHGIYVGSGTGDIFEIRECNLSNNKRCGLQINPELGGDRVIQGGKIVKCTIKGNAKSEGAALNLGAWLDGLLADCIIEDNAKGIALWQGDGARASRGCRIERCQLRRNGAYSLKCSNGSSGHRLTENYFDKKPVPGGWTSGPPAGTNRTGNTRW